MTRGTARTPDDYPAPPDVPAGPEVVGLLPTLEAMLAGDAALLPVPAFDAREKSLLTTALGVGSEIDDDVALVVSTPGTTGVPKGAMLTVAALSASASGTHSRLGGPGRWLLALPAHHIAGMQVLIRSVRASTTPVVMDVSKGFDASALRIRWPRWAAGEGMRRWLLPNCGRRWTIARPRPRWRRWTRSPCPSRAQTCGSARNPNRRWRFRPHRLRSGSGGRRRC